VSRKHKPKPHVNHERWLVSYADLITLLFAFFVVLYASSQTDKKKTARVQASIKGAFQELGVFTGSATDDIGVPGSPGITKLKCALPQKAWWSVCAKSDLQQRRGRAAAKRE
jgi:flagellar motor protein MotB